MDSDPEVRTAVKAVAAARAVWDDADAEWTRAVVAAREHTFRRSGMQFATTADGRMLAIVDGALVDAGEWYEANARRAHALDRAEAEARQRRDDTWETVVAAQVDLRQAQVRARARVGR